MTSFSSTELVPTVHSTQKLNSELFPALSLNVHSRPRAFQICITRFVGRWRWNTTRARVGAAATSPMEIVLRHRWLLMMTEIMKMMLEIVKMVMMAQVMLINIIIINQVFSASQCRCSCPHTANAAKFSCTLDRYFS